MPWSSSHFASPASLHPETTKSRQASAASTSTSARPAAALAPATMIAAAVVIVWAITGPIFHFNQLRHAQEAARKLADQAALQYQETVLAAFGEVDVSLTTVRTYTEEYIQRKVQAEACEQALRLSEARYKAGFTSYLEVLVQQENLFTAQLAASAALQGKLNASVLLYKSLGGGW